MILLLVTAGCQSFLPTPRPPTPTPVLLPRDVGPAATVLPATRAAIVSQRPTGAPPPTATALPLTASPAATTIGRLMAVGRRASILLRSRPVSNAAVAGRPAGSMVLWVEGRTADGRWLWVEYGDAGARAWAAAGDVQAFGDLATVPIVDAAAVAQVRPAPALTLAPGATGSDAARPSPAPTPATRPPSAPPLMGKIAFQTASGGDIYLIDANGANVRRITDGIDPALSPDGTQLAFARWASPHGIFVIDLRTGAERRVATADRPRGPTWKADGSALAFATVRRDLTCRDTPFGCYDEATIRRQFGGQECVQMPAGRFCIGDFPVREIQETGLVQVGAGGENRLDLPALNDAQSPAWHPTRGEMLLYRGGAGLQLTTANGETQPIMRDPEVNSPAWSPDGSRIAVQVRLHDNTDIFLLDEAGHRLARLTAPATSTAPAPDNVAPAWSPDGRYLLFLSNRDGAWRLYRMNADGSGQVLFAPAALAGITFRYDYAAERVASWSR